MKSFHGKTFKEISKEMFKSDKAEFVPKFTRNKSGQTVLKKLEAKGCSFYIGDNEWNITVAKLKTKAFQTALGKRVASVSPANPSVIWLNEAESAVVFSF